MNDIQYSAKYLGQLMHQARRQYHIPIGEMASILHVPTDTLDSYEKGKVQIPIPILERIFVIGFGTMSLKRNDRHYRFMTKVYFKHGVYKYIPINPPEQINDCD